MVNTIKTTILLAALTLLIMLFGQYLGGRQGLVVAFVLAMAMNFVSYWFSDKIVLAIYRAQEIPRGEYPELHAIVERLAQRAGIPKPKIYLIPSETPNAFATGRNPNHAVVAVTESIMRIMDYRELEGVLAHELSHVKNRDILISSIAATLAGVIMMLANMARWAALFGGFGRSEDDEDSGGGIIGIVVLSIIAPIAAMIIQLAISRAREYQADATGAQLAGTPHGLADALEKLDYANKRLPLEAAGPATAHLFIVNPLSARSLMALFSTHPPIEERIKRLRSLGSHGY
ncbi:MAG: zinc metalloprotease HtpX [Candidatus Tectomicrobia bacterium]|uniref:Protease HtpX homolog n=1 Tax=Tectimicrobiota bacterium TaxID=2528274 RepID=A0A933GJD5_UNCTE|nr:zinc metalloprotease HtpX [Candidatus Tectomicrobia bacterium]